MATSLHPRIHSPAHTEHCALCGRPIRPTLLANSGTTLENGRLVHVACLQPATRPPSSRALDRTAAAPKRPPSSLGHGQPGALIPRPPSTHAADLPKVAVPLRPPSSLATKLPKALTAPPLSSSLVPTAAADQSNPGAAQAHRWPRWAWAAIGALVGMALMALLFWLFHRSVPPTSTESPAPPVDNAFPDPTDAAVNTPAATALQPTERSTPEPAADDPAQPALAPGAPANPAPERSPLTTAPPAAPVPPTPTPTLDPAAQSTPVIPIPAIGATATALDRDNKAGPAAGNDSEDDPLPGQHLTAKRDGSVLLNLDGKTIKPDAGQWKRMTATTDGADPCLQWRGNVPEIVPLFQLNNPLTTPPQVNVHLRFKVDTYADRTLILRATFTDPVTQTERHVDAAITVKAAGAWVTADGLLRNLAGPLTQLELRPPSGVQEGMVLELSQLILSDGPAKGIAAPKPTAKSASIPRPAPPPARPPVAQPRPVWTPPTGAGAGQARQAQQAGQTQQSH